MEQGMMSLLLGWEYLKFPTVGLLQQLQLWLEHRSGQIRVLTKDILCGVIIKEYCLHLVTTLFKLSYTI